MPKWNPFFGHLLALNSAFKAKKLPSDVQRPMIFTALAEDFADTDIYYMDLWPLTKPLLLVTSPNLAIQATQQHDLGRPEEDLVKFLQPIAGGNNMLSANGDLSKHSRLIFSSGFNSNYILSQTANVVREAEVYVERLRKCAESGEIVQLDEITLDYTMDIAGVTTLYVF